MEVLYKKKNIRKIKRKRETERERDKEPETERRGYRALNKHYNFGMVNNAFWHYFYPTCFPKMIRERL